MSLGDSLVLEINVQEMANMTNQSLYTNSSYTDPFLVMNPCDVPTLKENIAFTVFLTFIMVVTLFGNFLVCLAVGLFPRLRRTTNYFIVSLACADLLVGCFSIPLRIQQFVHNGFWCLTLETCKFWIFMDLLCSCSSVGNLCIISIDRFMAINQPLRYHGRMTKSVGLALLTFVWTYSIVWALLGLMNWTDFGEEHFSISTQCAKADRIYYTVVSSCTFFLPLSIVITCYSFVLQTAWNQALAVNSMQIRDHRGRRSSLNFVREVKAARTLAIVVGAFTICWLPFFVILLISLWDGENLHKFSLNHKDAMIFISVTFVYLLPAINSTLNPVIYAVFNLEFRAAFAKLLQRVKSRRDSFGEPLSRLDVTNHNRKLSEEISSKESKDGSKESKESNKDSKEGKQHRDTKTVIISSDMNGAGRV